MSKPKAKQTSKTAKAAVAAAAPSPASPKLDQKEMQAKIAYLNRVLKTKPSEDDSRLVKKMREEMAAQNDLQKKLQEVSQQAQQLQSAIQSAGGRVNAVADLLWDSRVDGDA